MKLWTLAISVVITLCNCSLVGAQSEPTEPSTLSDDSATTQAFPSLDTVQKTDLNSESPDSVNSNLNSAAARPGVFKYGPVSLIDPYWQKFSADLNKHGIRIGAAYTILFQDPHGATTSAPAAVGGNLDIFGNWRLLGKPDGNTNGYLYYAFQQRSAIGTETAPKAIGNEIGSLWGTTNGFNEEPFVVKELYWQQQFWGDGLILRLGRLDPTNYYDTNQWQSDTKYFMNQAFSSFPVRAFPSPGIGMNLKIRLLDWMSLSTGIQNAQGNANTNDLGNFWDEYSLFTATELALTPKIPDMGLGNYRFTYWYRAATSSTGLPHDGGFDMSFDQQCGPHLIPFFRYGYSEGNVSKISNMISTGIGYRGPILTPSDVVGAAFSWGQPSTSALRSQYATEIFYRLQVSPDNQFTVGYQWIINPTFVTSESTVGIFELRWRVAL
jgi:porin